MISCNRVRLIPSFSTSNKKCSLCGLQLQSEVKVALDSLQGNEKKLFFDKVGKLSLSNFIQIAA
jgi:hypothetical protein